MFHRTRNRFRVRWFSWASTISEPAAPSHTEDTTPFGLGFSPADSTSSSTAILTIWLGSPALFHLMLMRKKIDRGFTWSPARVIPVVPCATFVSGPSVTVLGTPTKACAWSVALTSVSESITRFASERAIRRTRLTDIRTAAISHEVWESVTVDFQE